MSMAGRIINIKPLIPDGRFHVNHILRAADVSQDKGHMFRITPELQSQLQFWLVMLRACDGNVSNPDPDVRPPSWAINIFTDASVGEFGADGRRTGRGVGAVQWPMVGGPMCPGPLLFVRTPSAVMGDN